MNNRTSGAIQGAQTGAAAGPWGALIGGLIGAKAGGMQDTQNQLAKGFDAAKQMTEQQQQMKQDDMLAMDEKDKQNIMNGINNGYGSY